ncbi:MAG TPA: RDD family protein [Candidatus Acidoferrum sp.]|nr:RDD family protein [Candidatus Acidoferrum sp.]
MTKTCLQCGAVLPSSARACEFCETSPRTPTVARPERAVANAHARTNPPSQSSDDAWRDELAYRLETYRGRKRKHAPNTAQSRLPFDESATMERVASRQISSGPREFLPAASSAALSLAAVEMEPPVKEDFSFTIAIGRPPRKREDETRMVIDVSLPPDSPAPASEAASPTTLDRYGLYPVAAIEERRLAAVIDAACLFFVLGAFLALFSAIGGEFTVNKLSGAVCLATFAIVYLQYFALFTIFGGTTPGMMLRGLQVVSFSGEPPTPRQMLMRSAGYLLSAGTFFMGFLWSMWDEDMLTWHDRMSHTYLHSAESLAEADIAGAASSN